MPVAHALAPEVLEAAMRRAIALAARGPAENENPQVGCVLLDAAGATVAEGWHEGAGTPHAEVMALTNLSQLESAVDPGSLTAVVTLEPCNHTGRTGPCAQALIAAGIGRVVYGYSDPGDASSGGAATLAAAGVDVSGGLLATEIQEFIAPWLERQAGARRG